MLLLIKINLSFLLNCFALPLKAVYIPRLLKGEYLQMLEKRYNTIAVLTTF